MSKISVTTVAGLTSGANANKVIVESGDSLEIPSGNLTVSNGTSTLNGNVNSNGTITGAEVSNGNYMIDNWRLNDTFSNNGVVNTYWERFVRSGTAQLGTQMQEASGIFTFPRTGLYLVKFHANMYISSGAASEHIYISVTTDNSAYYSLAIAQTHGMSGAVSDASIFCETLVNVTNTSNVKVRFLIDGFEAGTYLHGVPNSNVASGFARTQVFFERKGPAQ